jgi:hypothetical protein
MNARWKSGRVNTAWSDAGNPAIACAMKRRGQYRTMQPISRSFSLESQGLVRASCVKRRLNGLIAADKPG